MPSPSRVGLNALFLDPGVSGGSETYLRRLVPAMIERFPSARFEVVTTRRGARALAADGWRDFVELLELPCDDDEPARRTLVEQLRLPRLAGERGWDVLHSVSNRGPFRVRPASVVTVHDVIFFEHRTMGWVSTHGMRWAVRAATRHADAIIAVSAAAADRIAATLGRDRSDVTAIPHGPGSEPGEAAPTEDVARRHGLIGSRAVLCVAAKRPHKNQRLLVEALPLLSPDVMLVLAGHDEGYGAELEETAARLGVAERVRLLERVSDPELEALWQIAACAAFPTLAEGFGLPVLEAMRRGVPVCCSDIPVLREVAGDAADFFDPSDPAAAAAAIERCMAASGERGLARAAEFSWNRAAAQTFDVYERAVAAKGRS